MVPRHDVLSYEDIRGRVDEVLRRHWPSGGIPVDVEHIADVGLCLDIVAVQYLHSGYGIDGFLSSYRRAIYVDSAVQEHSILYRYRFTIAHELGHYFLHERLFTDCGAPRDQREDSPELGAGSALSARPREGPSPSRGGASGSVAGGGSKGVGRRVLREAPRVREGTSDRPHGRGLQRRDVCRVS